MPRFFEHVAVVDKNSVNKKWSEMYTNKLLTISEIAVDKTLPFYCIGSCFAEYVKYALQSITERHCYPRFDLINYDSRTMMIDTINNQKFHMNHYSPDSILQEFERVLYPSKEFLPVKVDDIDIVDGRKLLRKGVSVYQDPYRREVFAKTEKDILALIDKIDNCVREGIEKSKNFVITLGLAEVFRSSDSGLVFNQYPGYLGVGYSDSSLRFERLSPSSIEKTLREIVATIKAVDSSNKIIFSVSPVPLQKTFSNDDVFSANVYSKSALRSSLESVIDPAAGVFYFPSYEIALNLGADFYQERDLRHVKREYVEMIMQLFMRSTEFASVEH